MLTLYQLRIYHCIEAIKKKIVHSLLQYNYWHGPSNEMHHQKTKVRLY